MKKYSRKNQGTFVQNSPWFLISSDLTKKNCSFKIFLSFFKIYGSAWKKKFKGKKDCQVFQILGLHKGENKRYNKKKLLRHEQTPTVNWHK